MFKKFAPSSGKTPENLFRRFLPLAWHIAWKEKRLWPFAILAAILQTGGLIDGLLFAIQTAQLDAQALKYSSLQTSSLITKFINAFQFTSVNVFLDTLLSIQNLIFLLIVFGAILACSVISQGVLFYGLWKRSRQEKFTLIQAIRHSSKLFFPLATLNIFTYLGFWISKNLMFMSLAQPTVSPVLSTIVYFLSVALFLVIGLIITSMHFFSANHIIIHNQNLVTALKNSERFIRQHLLICLEMGLILFGIGVFMFFVAFILSLFGSIPLYLLLNIFFLVDASAISQALFTIIAILMVVIYLIIGAWNTTFNYSAWNQAYLEMVDNKPLSRLHRWLKWLFK